MKYNHIHCVEITNDRTDTTVATQAVIIQNAGSMLGVHLSLRDYSKVQESEWMYMTMTPEQAREVARALNHYADKAEGT
jgi:hypothetical protein